MHDLTFAKEIIGVIEERSRKLAKGTKVTAVNASLSLMSHVKPETLKETFATLVKGTPLEKVAIKISPLSLLVKCQSCKYGFMIDRPVTLCPECKSSDLNVIYSKEFTVDSVEVEKTGKAR